MAVIKCKMCGGDLNITEGLSVVECEYCGSRQTIPSADNEKKMTLFTRAARLLRGCEFDKAAGLFESIVADFPEEAEAYWGLVLCKYGIEYVDDPATGKKIPTCHRSSFDSVLDDTNFEQACENTDAIARKVYRDEARQIEALRKRIIEVSGKEEPYDVFISYKETDDKGERTLDSVIAQDIYGELSAKGFRVFFSRISLENKLGVEYEPYIFAALNSATVMLVVGTDYEHFNAVWVKNEWSRFLKLISSGQRKVLIPVFKNMDAYDMPKEFAKLAAQDMGKMGAMQDLIRGVEKIIGVKKEEPKEEKRETVIVQQGGGPNVTALLKRGEMALQDGKWDDAKGYFDRVLDMDAECAEAYLGMFLVENQCRNAEEYAAAQIEKLSECQFETLTACEEQTERVRKAVEDNAVPGYLTAEELTELFAFDHSYSGSLHGREKQLRKTERFFSENRLLSRAKQYASPETAEKLKKMEGTVLAFLKDAAEKARAEEENCIEVAEAEAARMGQEARSRREADYEDACRALEQASEPRDYMKLSDLLERLNGYKNSEEIKKRCENALQRLKEQEEKKAKEKEKKFFTAAGITAVLALAVSMLVTKVIIPPIRYNEATELFTNGDYAGAAAVFEALGTFSDSAEKCMEARYAATEAKYAAAEAKYAAGDYAGAAAVFEALGDFKDSTEKLAEAQHAAAKANYAAAEAKYAAGDYAGAEAAFKALGTFSDSAEKCMEAKYAAAEAKYAAGDYAGAAAVFEALGDFKDSTEKLAEAQHAAAKANYAAAETKYAAEKYPEAAMMFFKAGDYKDSKARYIEAGQKAGMHHTVSAGRYHTVGLKSDGTAVATKYTGREASYDGQCDVSGWTDIVAVSAGDNHTVGLKSDGTAVATKYTGHKASYDGQCDVSGWTDIVAVSAGDNHTVGQKSDGRVVAVGYNDDGQCNVRGWTDIVAVSAGGEHTVGLKSDGTVVAVGDNRYGQCNVSGWTDIVAVSAGGDHTVGLKSDGTVVAVGSNIFYKCDVGNWTAIMAVSAGWEHTVGLKSDGTVVAVGSNVYGQCDVGGWTDIVEVSAGEYHTVGLKSDGTVVAVGDNKDGQCNVGGWTDIIVPEA